MEEAYRAYRAGQLAEFYAPLVVSDEELARGLADGSLALDTRLRDALRSLGFGEGAADARKRSRSRGSAAEAAAYAAYSALQESDLGLRLGDRVDALERRIASLERGPLARARRGRASVSDTGSRNDAGLRVTGVDTGIGARDARLAAAARVRPDARRGDHPLPSRARGLLARALGWPMAKGATWDYLAYYLQLLDSSPPLSELQLFRTPVTPLVLGIPLDLGGSLLLEAVFGVLFATAIVAWSALALTFGRVPALFSALLLLAYPAYATLYHQASSDAIFATGLACWALLLARTMERPSGWRFVALGAGIAGLVLIRAANEILPLAFVPLVAAVPWRKRLAWSAACLASAVPSRSRCGRASTASATTRRPCSAAGGPGSVPARVHGRPHDLPGERGRIASPRRPRRAGAREGAAHAGLGVTLDAYLANGTNYETVRLIALSDEVLGRDENYGVLFESAVEAIREHPGRTSAASPTRSGTSSCRRRCARTSLRASRPRPRRRHRRSSRTASCCRTPRRTSCSRAVPYGFVWCASDYIDSCTLDRPSLVWEDSATQRRYRGVVAQVRSWDADLPSREGVSFVPELLNRITPRYPRPPLWLLVGAVALVVRRAARGPSSRSGSRPGSSCSCTPSPRASPPVRPPAVPGLRRDGARRALGRPRASAEPDERVDAQATDARARADGTRRAPSLRDARRTGFWLDELVTVSLLDRSFGDMLGGIRETEATPYLYYALAWRLVARARARRGRAAVLSALVGTAAIPVAYGAGAAFCTRRVGVVAAALVAVHPFLVWYAQEARAYSLLVLLGACTVLFLGRALRARRVDLAGWAVASSLAIATHYFAVFLVAAGGLAPRALPPPPGRGPGAAPAGRRPRGARSSPRRAARRRRDRRRHLAPLVAGTPGARRRLQLSRRGRGQPARSRTRRPQARPPRDPGSRAVSAAARSSPRASRSQSPRCCSASLSPEATT